MARFLSRFSTRIWLRAATMTVITMLAGIAIFYGTARLLHRAIKITDLSMLAMAVFTGVGGGLSALLVRRMSGLITTVADAAARVADGEYGVRVDDGCAAGEHADLIRHFNAVASMIDLYERERNVLTAGVAHEMRTPLTILKGRLHALKDGVIDPERGDADRLLRQVDHLLRIVGDMGTLALADAGRLALAVQTVNLADVVRAAVTDMKPLIASLDLFLDESYRIAPVRGDALRLTQVINNLLANAIKHAPPRSIISICVLVLGDRALASVTDEGPGFAPEDGPKLFTPFWRSGSNAHGHTGNGIGLALCALVTTAHGGYITGHNRTDRTGAVFTISLPLIADPPSTEPS